MKPWLKSLLQYAFGFSLGAALLYFSFRNVKWEEMRTMLADAHYEYFVASIAVYTLANIMRSYRWVLMLRASGHPASSQNTFWAVMVGYMANSVVPRLGEVMRCTVLRRTDNVPVSAAFGTVVTERALDVLVLLLMMGTLVIFELGRLVSVLEQFFPLGGLAILAGAGVVGLLGLVLLYFLRDTLKKNATIAKVYLFVEKLFEAALSFRNLKNPGLFVLLTIGIWLGYTTINYILFRVLDNTADYSFYFAFVLTTLSALGMVLPVPGGVGAYHTAIRLTFIAFGLSADVGIVYAVVTHTPGYLYNVIVGAIGYFVLLFRFKQNEATTATQP
jgi:glycosyltransferase 2 family protein